MALSFTTFALEPEHLRIAFPLVSAALPRIALADWLCFAGPILTNGSATEGAVGLRKARGYLCGLTIHRIEQDLQHGRVLAIDLFVALDLVHEAAATHALIEAVEALGRHHDCAITRIRLATEHRSLVRVAKSAGFEPADQLFCKKIPKVQAH